MNRRRFLEATGTVGFGIPISSQWPARDTTRDPDYESITPSRGQPESQIESHLVYPDNPFIVPEFGAQFIAPGDQGGWTAASTTQKIRTVLDLHPDVLDYNPLSQFRDGELVTTSSAKAQLQFSKRTGIPGTAGWNVTIKPEPERAMRRYGPLMRELSWTYPDGTPLDNPRGILAEKFNGDPHKIEFTFETTGIPSVFAPGNLDLLVRATERRLREGFAGFFVDGVGIFRFQGLDFSVWATSAFQEHLGDLPDERLAELGIDNPDEFDIRSYLEAENLTPNYINDPREDPVFREYLLYHHLGIKSFFKSYREAVADRFPERMAQSHIKLYGNQFMGNFGDPQSANVYVSDSFDLINTEMFPTVQPGVDFVYKLLEALGRFSKPALAKGTLNGLSGPRKQAFDPDQPYRMLKRFQVAEGIANGAIFKPPLTPRSAISVDESITNWIQADGTVHDDLQAFIDFVWAHRRFLEETDSNANVAVVWSLPTRLWWHEPQWRIGGGKAPRIDSFVGTTRLLREAQIPYDILVFGHPRLWDDRGQLDRLTQYEAVILPGVQCLSEPQRSALDAYLNDGGSVLTSGQAPNRTEMFVRSDDVKGLFERSGVTVLSDDPGSQRETEGSSDGSLIDALPINSIVDESDEHLGVSVFSQSEEPRNIAHLLNYDYDPADDSFSAKTNVSLQLSPDHPVGVARYFAPQQITDLDISRNADRIEVSVPEIVEWGFVVLAPSQAELVDESAKQSATSLVDEAQQRLDNARANDRDWGPNWATAEIKMAAANTAMEYNAYSQAEQPAKEAIAAVEETFPRPTVGIDLAHNQLDSLEKADPYAWLDERFGEYQYSRLEQWDAGALEDVDVLFVPPALAFRGETYEFSADELDRVQRFVQGGGSLVVMVRGGVARDIDDLTERFDYRFLGPPIVFPEEHSGKVPTQDHSLTKGVDRITASLERVRKTPAQPSV